MNRRWKIYSAAVMALSLSTPGWSQDAGGDGELRAVVILARHGVRAPIGGELREGIFNAQPWPTWPVDAGMLTPHGIDALKRMGEFYRAHYGSLVQGCTSVEALSTNTPRTIGSAKAVMSVVAPRCDVEVKTVLTTDPPGMDKTKFQDAVDGRMGDDPKWFTQTYARPLAAMHDVLTKCTGCKTVPDFRTRMIDAMPAAMTQGMMQPASANRAEPRVVVRDLQKENAVAVGADLAENLLLEYVEGMPMSSVGWGRVDRAKLDELMEMNTRYHDFMLRTPYWAQQAAGPLADRIARILASVDVQQSEPGDLTAPSFHPVKRTSERFFYLSAHDANLGWLGGLLKLDWKVRDEARNATPPGSAMVFELWCSAPDARTSRENSCRMRVKFVAQTLDQIRELRPLTGTEGPSISPVFVPGCSGAAPEYACSPEQFLRVVQRAVR